VLTYSIKKDFTYKSCEWRSWRKKRKLYVRWEVYNSLHWQINSSELLENHASNEKNSSANLTCTKQANMCQQTLTIIQQPFQRLKAQPWRKERGDVMSWTHTKVLWSSCLLRPKTKAHIISLLYEAFFSS
jgi:hypothetical protein